MKLLFASSNPHKVEEVRAILSPLGIDVVGLDSLDGDPLLKTTGPVHSRQILAVSFGREAFHAGPSTATTAGGAVAVAYAIRWLELGDRIDRPAFEIWLAESATGPVRLPPDGDPSTSPRSLTTTIVD